MPLVQDFKECFLRSLFAIAPPHPRIEPVYIPGGTGATIFCYVIYSAFVVSNEGNKKKLLCERTLFCTMDKQT
jgi:hypothetical protein